MRTKSTQKEQMKRLLNRFPNTPVRPKAFGEMLQLLCEQPFTNKKSLVLQLGATVFYQVKNIAKICIAFETVGILK